MAKKKQEASTLADVMRICNDQCGPGTMFTGNDLAKDPPRLPSGVFAVDYATGGGLPLWGTTCNWGAEASGKTTLALSAAKMCQMLCWRCFNLQAYCTCSQNAIAMQAYWGDVEGTLDREWATAIGVVPEQYTIGLADYGEQHVNIADSALRADDCGLVIIDSLAAMVPASEMEAAEEDQFIGLQARMITRMVRKLKQRLIRERKRGHPCAVLFTNQVRIKIGQMFGNPETMPGGRGLQHEFSLLLRCVKKSLRKDGADGKYWVGDRNFESASRHSFAVKKAKVLTIAGIGEYVICREDLPDLKLQKGKVDDYQTVMNYAKEYGLVQKEKKGWSLTVGGKTATVRLQDEIKDAWRKHSSLYHATQMAIVTAAKERLRPRED